MNIQSLQSIFNETEGYLNVVADKQGRLTLKVLDTNGRMAKSLTTNITEGIQKLALNLSDLSSGMYVLNAFTDGTFLKSIRFIKQ
jgi:hypothetical protein